MPPTPATKSCNTPEHKKPCGLFKLNEPCENCPFLRDQEAAIELSEGRKESIISDVLRTGQSFNCHKTVYEKGSTVKRPESQNAICAGAAAMARKAGKDMDMVKIASRLGELPYDYYDKAEALTLDVLDVDFDTFEIEFDYEQ